MVGLCYVVEGRPLGQFAFDGVVCTDGASDYKRNSFQSCVFVDLRICWAARTGCSTLRRSRRSMVEIGA